MSIEQTAKTALETLFPGQPIVEPDHEEWLVYLNGRSVSLFYSGYNEMWYATITSLTSPDVHVTNSPGEKDPLTAICNATNEYRKVVTRNYAIAKAAYDYVISDDIKTA